MSNLVTSSGHVGKKFLPTIASSSPQQLYRGVRLDPATTAASKMLSQGTLDIRFGIQGEEQEIADLLQSTAVTLEEVGTWTKGGGAACCIVADRDDAVVAVCRCTGIRSGEQVVTLDQIVLPLDTTGERFVAKAIGMCRGWGCTTIHMHVPTQSTKLLDFLKSCADKKEWKAVESYNAAAGDFVVLTL